MRKFIATFLCFISFAFSQEKEMQTTNIFFTLQYKEDITPDILKMNTFINASGSRESDVINILGEVDKAIRNLKLEYSGGNYLVQKRCWWEDGKRKCKGYTGEIEYSFMLQRASDQNKVLDILDSFKEKFGEIINYTVSQTVWIVSENKIKDIDEQLKLKLLNRAKDFTVKVSKNLGKECYIKSVNYGYINYIDLEDSRIHLKSLKSIEAPEPKADNISISTKATVELICR